MVRLLALALLLTSPLSANPSATDLIASGRAAMGRGEISKAVELYEKGVKAYPRNAELHYLLGGAYGREAQQASMVRQAGLAKKARTSLETAVRLDPTHTRARFGLIDFYLIAPAVLGGSTEKALAQAAEIKKVNPVDGHRAYSRIHARQKNPDLARKELSEAVRAHPRSPQARYYLGSFLLNEKNYDAAIRELEQARQLDPKWLPPLFRIGQHAALTGSDFSRGEAALKAYLAQEPAEEAPSHAAAWYWLGTLYEKQGRNADARQSFGAAQKLAPQDKSIQEAVTRVR